MFNAITAEATFHLAHAIKQQLAIQLEAQDLGIAAMHLRVLKVIGTSKACTAIDIAGLFKRDKAQITRLVSQLIDKGYIQKKPNPHDKRSQLLALTSEGEILQKKIGALSNTLEKQMRLGIEAEDLDTFTRVAQIMTKNLTKETL